MEAEHMPETLIALYTTLADAEAALHELQSAGVPYPDIRLDRLAPRDLAYTPLADRLAQAGDSAPEQYWSLSVVLEPAWSDKAADVLRKYQPVALGTIPALERGRGDTERGAIAWRHYVFESPAATDWAGESAGTTGTTGIATSGAFGEGAKVEDNQLSTGDQRPADKREQPSSDTMRPDTSIDRSRPETELKD
jgi:hypothetical protein